MGLRQKISTVVCVVVLVSHSVEARPVAQNINGATPLTSVHDNYFESFGSNFGFSIPGGRPNGSRVVGLGAQGQLLPNLVFFQNGTGGAIPLFGGYTPNSGARFGFGNVGPNGGYSLGFNLAQGSTRTSTMVAPSLTVQNGFGGSMFSGQYRPFVTGVVPVVGGGAPGFSNVAPGYLNPGYSNVAPIDNGVTRAMQSGQLDLRSRIEPSKRSVPSAPVTFSNDQSSALRGDLSVAQIKAQRAKKLELRKREFDETLAEARQLDSEQRYAEARIKYKAASRLTDDRNLQDQIKQLISASRAK